MPLAHARIVSLDVGRGRACQASWASSRRRTCPASRTALARSSTTRNCWRRTSAGTSVSRSSPWRANLARPCRQAQRAVKVGLEELPAVLSIDQAIAAGAFLGERRRIARGDADGVLAHAPHVIEGTFRTGGQEHFYLETQAALAVPGEGGSLVVYSSTQNPSEIQAMVAHCLGLHQSQVVCIATRMGGAFGGKESQAAGPAMLASLVAHKTGRPARLVYSRELDMQDHRQAAPVSRAVSRRLRARRADLGRRA